NARSVFSGACVASPRWASTRGGAGCRNSTELIDSLSSRLLLRAGTELVREPAADSLERLRELRGNDPQLVGLTLRDLGKRQQVLVREQLRVGVAVVDGLEYGRDRLRLTLRAEHRGLGVALGAENRR